MEHNTEVLQNFKNRNIIRCSTSTFGDIYQGNEITILKRYLHPDVHCSIIYNSQDSEKLECLSIDEWMNKM